MSPDPLILTKRAGDDAIRAFVITAEGATNFSVGMGPCRSAEPAT
jgi:hypothetical protein